MLYDYKLEITEPWTHYVKVRMKLVRKKGESSLELALPSWSPGSYYMREYSRNIRRFRATTSSGEFIYFEKSSKNIWKLDWDASLLNSKDDPEFSIDYEVYCNELSVRTSHVNTDHAFIHGPSIFMFVKDHPAQKVNLEVKFPGIWNKLNTGLKDVSKIRDQFHYEADNYDDFIDTPIEIGCQDTTGFRVKELDHHIVNFNQPANFPTSFRSDCKKIVETIADFWGEIPYDQYVFISHFLPGIYGGLEHKNSTALQFDELEVQTDKGYKDFLGLVAHEYFHTWNVKRIRPKELGAFDYLNENYTRMHWLTEGLTSFVDDLFVYNSDLTTLNEYLTNLCKRINRLISSPGRHFDSLEDASFDAWIKLYRPNENSRNSTISYYLKGALSFFCLNALLIEGDFKLKDFCQKLWSRFKDDPDNGVTKEEVLELLESISTKDIRDHFETMISTTEDLPLKDCLEKIGLKAKMKRADTPSWGFSFKEKEGSLFIDTIRLDSAAYKCGLNHNDEVLAVGNKRLSPKNYQKWLETVKCDNNYEFLINRLGQIYKIEITPEKGIEYMDSIEIVDKAKVIKGLSLS